MIDFFGGNQIIWYVVAFGLMAAFWAYAASGNKKTE